MSQRRHTGGSAAGQTGDVFGHQDRARRADPVSRGLLGGGRRSGQRALTRGVSNGQPEEFVSRLTGLIPMGRMARHDGYRGAIQFLCSDALACMTGQNAVIDGGRSILQHSVEATAVGPRAEIARASLRADVRARARFPRRAATQGSS
jgi:NAD(P)-dependent dehydrogenase (short-subunit alcohol dehydrogenase family)